MNIEQDEKDCIYAALMSYADQMEKRAKESVYAFYMKDNERVKSAVLWEVEHMRLLAKTIKGKDE